MALSLAGVYNFQVIHNTPHKINSILSILFYLITLCKFTIKCHFIFYILAYYNNSCKRDLVFENIVSCISENRLSHSLKMTLRRKLKCVTDMIF